MFQHRSAIFRESIKTKEHKSNTPIQVGLASLCFNGLSEDCTQLPKKHVCRSWYPSGLMFHDLNFMEFYRGNLLVIMLNVQKCSVWVTKNQRSILANTYFKTQLAISFMYWKWRHFKFFWSFWKSTYHVSKP